MKRDHCWARFCCFCAWVLPLLLVLGCAETPGRKEPLAGMVNSLFSPNGELVAVATNEREVALFSVQPLWFRKMLTKESDKQALGKAWDDMVASQFRALPLAFSPDGKMLVALGVAGQIVAWDVESGTEAYRVPTNGAADDLAFMPHGHSFVTAGAMLTVHQASDGMSEFQLPLPAGSKANSVAISPDGTRIIAGLSSGEIAVFNVPEYRLLTVLKRHMAPVSGLAFRPDGQVFSSTAGGYDLQFWQRDPAGNFARTKVPYAGAAQAREAVEFSQGAGVLLWVLGTLSGARIAGAPTLGAPPVWAGVEGQFERAAKMIPYHCGPRVAFSANGRFFASTANLLACPGCIGRLTPAFMLFITDLDTGRTVTARDRGCAVALSPDGRVVTAGGLGAPALLDSTTGNVLPAGER